MIRDRAVPIDRHVLEVAPSQAVRLQLASDLEQTHAFGGAGRALATTSSTGKSTLPIGLYPVPVDSGIVPSLGEGADRGLTIQGLPVVSAADVVLSNVLIPPSRQEFDAGAAQQLFSLVSPMNEPEASVRDQLLGGDPVPAARSTDPVVAALGQLALGLCGGAGLGRDVQRDDMSRRRLAAALAAGPKPIIEAMAAELGAQIEIAPRVPALAYRLCLAARGAVDFALSAENSA